MEGGDVGDREDGRRRLPRILSLSCCDDDIIIGVVEGILAAVRCASPAIAVSIGAAADDVRGQDDDDDSRRSVGDRRRSRMMMIIALYLLILFVL